MDVLPMLEAEAKERQGARIDPETSVKKFTDVEPRSTRASEQAAQMVGTNRQYVSDAKRLRDEAPELLERVRSGELTCSSCTRSGVKSPSLPAVLKNDAIGRDPRPV